MSASLLANLRLAKGRLGGLNIVSLSDLEVEEEARFELYGSRHGEWLRSRRALISAELAMRLIQGMDFSELAPARYDEEDLSERTDPGQDQPPVEDAQPDAEPEAHPEPEPETEPEPFDPIVETDDEVTIAARTADVMAELERADAEGDLGAPEPVSEPLDEVDIDDLDDELLDDLPEETLNDRTLPEETVQDDGVPGSEEYDLEDDSAPAEEIADSDSVFDIDDSRPQSEETPSDDADDTGEIESGEVDDTGVGFDAIESALFEDNDAVPVLDTLTRPADRNHLVDDLGGQPILPTIRDRTAPPPVAAAAIQITPEGARPVGARLGGAEDEEIVELPPSDDPELDGMAPADSGFHFEAEEMEFVDDAAHGRSQAPQLTPDGDYPAYHDGSHELTNDEISEVAPVDPAAVKRLQDSATEALDRGDLNAAAMAYSSLLEMDPSNLDAYLGRGRCFLDLGDYAAAMSDFQKAEDLDPEGPESLVAMGELFFARKEYSRAIEFFDQAIELDNAHAMARCRRGISYYYKKSYRQAFLDLQKAYTLDPEIPNIRKYVQMAIKKLERSGEG